MAETHYRSIANTSFGPEYQLDFERFGGPNHDQSAVQVPDDVGLDVVAGIPETTWTHQVDVPASDPACLIGIRAFANHSNIPTSNFVEPTQPFIRTGAGNNTSINTITGYDELQILSGFGRGFGSLSVPATEIMVSLDEFPPMAPPTLDGYGNLSMIQETGTGLEHCDKRDMPTSLHNTPRRQVALAPLRTRNTAAKRRRRTLQNRPPAVSFRTIMKPVYECTMPGCNKQYGRIADLQRHHRCIHSEEKPFPCRFAGCERAVKGFGRKDKRNDHERAMHPDKGETVGDALAFE